MATSPAAIATAPNTMPAIAARGFARLTATNSPSGDIAGQHRRDTQRHPNEQPACGECQPAQDHRGDAGLISGCFGVAHARQF